MQRYDPTYMKPSKVYELLDRKPFRPFIIELDNGRRIGIKHPENLIPIPDRATLDFFIAVLPGRERRYCHFEPSVISALDWTEPNGRSAAG